MNPAAEENLWNNLTGNGATVYGDVFEEAVLFDDGLRATDVNVTWGRNIDATLASVAIETAHTGVTGDGGNASLFAGYTPRRLPAESLLDAIVAVTEVPTKYPGVPLGEPASAIDGGRRNIRFENDVYIHVCSESPLPFFPYCNCIGRFDRSSDGFQQFLFVFAKYAAQAEVIGSMITAEDGFFQFKF